MTVARIVLGITGGIAAYKACELCRLLVRDGPRRPAVPTRGAERFVAAETFAALARQSRAARPVPAPAARGPARRRAAAGEHAGKLAHGLADNVLTEAALAHRGPLLVAPAMNTADVGASRHAGEPRDARASAAS